MLNIDARAGSREIHKLQISYIFGISYRGSFAQISLKLLKQLVRMIGLEPTLPRGNWNLNPNTVLFTTVQIRLNA
jgi:hypothetical protein